MPVVVVTARLAERSRAESYEAGATDFVPKPYTPDQIFQALGSADVWNQTLRQTPREGRITCKLADRQAIDRQLTGLRSLLLGRSPLDSEAVDQVASAVRAMCASASPGVRKTEWSGGERRIPAGARPADPDGAG